jgi:putative DNA methylase
MPIDQIGAQCMRERGTSSPLPPLYFLHVWWARRPVIVKRAPILNVVIARLDKLARNEGVQR